MVDNSELKILIVDDVAKNIQVVGNILQDQSYDIYFANNGYNAIRQIENNNFDLILLDVMMPEIDGFETCLRIKQIEHAKEVPVMFLTAKTDIESTVRGFEVGGIDYVTKPFNSTELLARIKTHLHLKKAKEELVNKNIEIENQKSELERINSKLLSSQDELKDLNATKDKFFSIVAHDLKNPLSTLIGFTDILLKNGKSFNKDGVDQIYKMIHNASKQGFSLLENLLEWSRAQTGRLELCPEIFDLKSIVRDTYQLLISTAQSKKVELIDSIDENTYVYADKNTLNTVIRNLVSNAIKFTPEEGKVMIYAATVGNEITVTIEDTGIGIEEKNLSKLFRIDVNPSTLGTAKERGTGLGLILCKEFIETNKGRIWVESKEGEGSKFIFSLPIKE